MSERNEQEVVKKGMSRRGFLKAGGAAMGTVVLGGVVAGCGDNVTRVMNADSTGTNTGTGTGTSAMTLAEANALRKKIIDSKGDYTCANGTVIPAVYVKLRALINSLGCGVGSEVNDVCFDEYMYLFSKEEAQACLEMPIGERFTAADFSVVSGRTEESCVTICESLAKRGLIFRARMFGVAYYHLMAEAHGIWEAQVERYTVEYLTKFGNNQSAKDFVDNFRNSGTPFYYTLPVTKEIVTTGQVISYDDYEKIIKRNTSLAVSPCQCHQQRKVLGAVTDSPFPLERCISTGEEAEFYIENGNGRKITQDEALSIVQNNVKLGMVIQHCYSKAAEVICSCHPTLCNILGGYEQLFKLTNGGILGNSMQNVSHYILQYNKDACIKCGKCAKQCPMGAVTMGADGFPSVDTRCVRCCQCGTTCPASARKLLLKESFPELPDTLLDDYSLKAQYRMSKNMIY